MVWAKGENADMHEYFTMLAQMLNVVHRENMILLSLLTGKKLDDEWLKEIDEKFKEACKVDK